MADNNNNSSNDIDLHQTAAAFMEKIMNNDRVQELQQQSNDDEELKIELKSRYDALPDEPAVGVPEPNQTEMRSTNDDSELLQDRLVAILNRGYSTEQAPEPGNETMHSETTEPERRQTDQQASVDNDLRSNPENVNDQSAPEPGQEGFTEESVKIVVDRAPNVDQSETPDFYPEESHNNVSSAPEPTFEQTAADTVNSSAPEPGHDSFVEQNNDIPEPGHDSFARQTSDAPEPGKNSLSSEAEGFTSSAPEPSDSATFSHASSAPEPTVNGTQPKLSAEEQEEEEDSFPSDSFNGRSRLRPKQRRTPWKIPEESSGSIDKFGTIRQNIRHGNTSSLRDMWEKMGKN